MVRGVHRPTAYIRQHCMILYLFHLHENDLNHFIYTPCVFIVITDSGFGRQVTNMLSSAGHGVFAGVFLEASMEALVEEFKGNKGNVVPV